MVIILKMTESDFAERIYCLVYNVNEANGDVYVRGVMDAIISLADREQAVLNDYYRCGMTNEQIGREMRISGGQASEIKRKAIRKLRHISRSRKMSVSRIVGEYIKLIDSKDETINELYIELENLANGKPMSRKVIAELNARKMGIDELGLSSRAFNVLYKAGVQRVEQITLLDKFALLKIRGFGEGSLSEVVRKMREHGFSKWVENIEK